MENKMKKRMIIISCLILLLSLISNLHAKQSLLIGVDVLQSVGRQFYGAKVGYLTNGTGAVLAYYHSFAPKNGTIGTYIPLYFISATEKLTISFGSDIRSLFSFTSKINKSASTPKTFELALTYHPISILPIGLRYLWSPGGYFPKCLSLSVGLEFFLGR
jgi:hypothetical protein